MKKIISLTIAAAALCNVASAQWALTGNAIGAADFFGTTNARDIVFKVNSAERMHLTQNGCLTMGSNNTLGATNTFSAGIGEMNSVTGNSSFATGYNNTSSNYTSAVFNSDNTASGDRSFAAGFSSEATGTRAFATGDNTQASGTYAATFNQSTVASATGAFAANCSNTASGNCATALGNNTTAHDYASLTIGQYNTIGTGSTTTWVAGEQLLVAGNGASAGARSNALILFKNGNVTIGGTLTTGSDARLKRDIVPLQGVLAKLEGIQPVNYFYKDGNAHPAGLQLGVIAQEIEKAWPELVLHDAEGYRSVAYPQLSAVAIEAIKEQQAIIKSQQSEIADLNERLSRLEASLLSHSGIGPDTDPSSSVSLSQNSPNPTDEVTAISYILPESAINARLVLTEAGSGREVRSYGLSGGVGSVTVSVKDLAAGSYVYSIVMEGKLVQSRRMVVAK